MDVGADLRCRALWAPKRGNSTEEYEDASAFDCASGRFAVADGASESVFAREWAGILCRSYVADSLDPAKILDWRQAMQKRWTAQVRTPDLPWYLEEKLNEGAFATFLGVTFRTDAGDAGRAWQALAVGDACLFHVRGGALLSAFPLDRGDEFGTRPNLIGSRQRSAVVPLIAEGVLQPGDRLLMMTDALSEWFLRSYEDGGAPWADLIRLRENDFPQWVDALRESHAIKNDDVTLLVVEV